MNATECNSQLVVRPTNYFLITSKSILLDEVVCPQTYFDKVPTTTNL